MVAEATQCHGGGTEGSSDADKAVDNVHPSLHRVHGGFNYEGLFLLLFTSHELDVDF